jgi:CheY-like chemotaxis protein
VMPGMGGWELLQMVRQHYPALPVLLYSSLPSRRPEGFEVLEFNDALLKPASGKLLLTRINRLLAQASELST